MSGKQETAKEIWSCPELNNPRTVVINVHDQYCKLVEQTEETEELKDCSTLTSFENNLKRIEVC